MPLVSTCRSLIGNVVKLDAFDFNTDLEVTHGSRAKT